MKKLIIEILIGIPIVIGVYALLDFLYCTFITRSPFSFSIGLCMSAVGLWILVEVVLYLTRKKKKS